MWRAFTRAELRDAIRREIRITPPNDAGLPGAVIGQQPPNQKNPSNPLLNQLIDKVMSNLNRKVAFGGTNSAISTPIAAQTATGPYAVNLSTSFNQATFQINKIKHAWWIPDGDTVGIPLEWVSADNINRTRPQWVTEAVGVPQMAWVVNNTLQIFPAPSAAGTLYVTAELGVNAAVSDNDTLGVLPADYYPIIVDAIKLELAAIQLDDAVFVDQYRHLAPTVEQGIGEMVRWINERNGNYQSGLRYRSPRVLNTRSR